MFQYLPLYRQVKEWNRYGLLTNDKNLSNWVIRIAEDWLHPIYHRMKELLMKKSILHIDETYAQILNRSDGKSAQSNAYNWSEALLLKGRPSSCFIVRYREVGKF